MTKHIFFEIHEGLPREGLGRDNDVLDQIEETPENDSLTTFIDPGRNELIIGRGRD